MDNEDYQEVIQELTRYKLQDRASAILANFGLDSDDFVIKFETVRYTLKDTYEKAPAAEYLRGILETIEQECAAARVKPKP